MRIFISWSGDVGLQAAHVLEPVTRRILPFIEEVWISPQIEAGKVGAQAILESIRRVDAGLVLLTPQSQHAPWVIFEAGAFAYRDRLVPLLLGLASEELSQPFPNFQYREATRAGLPRAMLDLWRIAMQLQPDLQDTADEVLSRSEVEWPALREALSPLVTASRAMTRELQFGPSARYINQAEREASEQRHRAEHQEFRANAFRSLLEFFLRYERGLDQISPDQFISDMRRDMPVIRRIVETEDFGRIEEGHPWTRPYTIDD